MCTVQVFWNDISFNMKNNLTSIWVPEAQSISYLWLPQMFYVSEAVILIMYIDFSDWTSLNLKNYTPGPILHMR